MPTTIKNLWNTLTGQSDAPAPVSPEALKRVLRRDDRVKAAFEAVTQARAVFQARFAEFEHLLDPHAFAEAHRIAINQATTVEDIEQASRQLSALEGPGAELAKNRARALWSDSFHDFVQKIPPLLDAAESVLEEMRAEVIESETKFFGGWGLPREATGVSKRLDGITADLKNLRDGLALHYRQGFAPVPNAFENFVSYFSA